MSEEEIFVDEFGRSWDLQSQRDYLTEMYFSLQDYQCNPLLCYKSNIDPICCGLMAVMSFDSWKMKCSIGDQGKEQAKLVYLTKDELKGLSEPDEYIRPWRELIKLDGATEAERNYEVNKLLATLSRGVVWLNSPEIIENEGVVYRSTLYAGKEID